jgi:hypothetical protein
MHFFVSEEKFAENSQLSAAISKTPINFSNRGNYGHVDRENNSRRGDISYAMPNSSLPKSAQLGK